MNGIQVLSHIAYTRAHTFKDICKWCVREGAHISTVWFIKYHFIDDRRAKNIRLDYSLLFAFVNFRVFNLWQLIIKWNGKRMLHNNEGVGRSSIIIKCSNNTERENRVWEMLKLKNVHRLPHINATSHNNCFVRVKCLQ